MKYLLALDQGTTSSRAVVYDAAARPVGFAQRSFTQHFPQPGWVEHDPSEILATQLTAAHDALEKAGVAGSDVAGIGITNQRETTILWDRASGAPVAPAIVWQDRRTAVRCDELRARGVGERVRERTGLVLDPYFSATKIAWLLDHVAGLRERAENGQIAFGTVDSWLVWNLTGGARHVTDFTNASRTMLFDVNALRWDDELLAAFNVPRAVLPEALPCTADFGTALERHFGHAIPIGGVAGDQQSALVGQLCFDPGLAKNTYGTGSFVVLNTGKRLVQSKAGLLATIGYAFEPDKATYALEGSIFSTGATVQWLRDGLAVIDDASEIEALASSVADSGDVFVVPAFAGLGAPYWDAYARGTIVGITRGTTAAHLARAVLESTAYQTADVVAAMERDAGIELSELRVDGGAAVNDFLMQLQADALGVTVARPQNVETTALGAAYLAGLQRGVWSDLDALRTQSVPATRFAPAASAAGRAKRLERWHRAVERSRGWAE